MVDKIKLKSDFLIEVLREAANPIGGVYTVVSTKAIEMVKYYKGNYYAVGAYENIKNRFKEAKPPKTIKKILNELKREKIDCYYGYWLIPGKPKTISVDYSKLMKNLKKIKKETIKKTGIDFRNCGVIVDQLIVWNYCLCKLFEKLLALKRFKNKKGVVSFHLPDGAILFQKLKKEYENIATMYTCHSTKLGRAIVANNGDLNKEIPKGKLKKKKEYNYGGKIVALHQMEKRMMEADVFTAVSKSTAIEAKYILGRKPDIITPNGLEMEDKNLRNILIENRKNRKKINNFLKKYFEPYYKIDLSKSFLFYTSGRYEFRIKGYGTFLDALGKLNKLLKKEKLNINVIPLLFVRNKGKKTVRLGMKEGKNPSPCAFYGVEKDDPIMNSIKRNKLLNSQKDKVKVIFYPGPVGVDDNLLNMHYRKVVSAMDLGVFPSIYEPWGYTPLETASRGIIAITTNAAGFGKFVLEKSKKIKKKGIVVLKVEDKKKEDIIKELTNTLYKFVHLSQKERALRACNAYKIAGLCDWKNFAKYYIKAHNLAIEKMRRRTKEV